MSTAPVFCADSSSEVGELDVDRELVLDEFNASVCSLEVIAACRTKHLGLFSTKREIRKLLFARDLPFQN